VNAQSLYIFVFELFIVYLLQKTTKILYNLLGAMNSAWKDGMHKRQSKEYG